MDDGILSGLRVLDFTWMLAGPFATRILADFGAEVIKVQSGKTATGAESNVRGYFNNWNRNKRSIALDMTHPEGRELVLKLAGISDVVIDNFSPRVMANWGLNYEALKEVNPDLIMVSMSGLGQTGPWRNFVAFGPTLHALSGLTSLTSFPDTAPVGLGYAHADPIAGLYAAFSVLAALECRDRTGQGQYIDLSEYEAICTLMGPALLNVAVNHEEAKAPGKPPGLCAGCSLRVLQVQGDGEVVRHCRLRRKRMESPLSCHGEPSMDERGKVFHSDKEEGTRRRIGRISGEMDSPTDCWRKQPAFSRNPASLRAWFRMRKTWQKTLIWRQEGFSSLWDILSSAMSLRIRRRSDLKIIQQAVGRPLLDSVRPIDTFIWTCWG